MCCPCISSSMAEYSTPLRGKTKKNAKNRAPHFRKSSTDQPSTYKFLSMFQGCTKTTRDYLEARVSEIVHANTWLASQVDRYENGEFSLYYPIDVSAVKRFYEHAPIDLFSKSKTYDETVRELKLPYCRSCT